VTASKGIHPWPDQKAFEEIVNLLKVWLQEKNNIGFRDTRERLNELHKQQ